MALILACFFSLLVEKSLHPLAIFVRKSKTHDNYMIRKGRALVVSKDSVHLKDASNGICESCLFCIVT
jgi:hypothetical protein